MKQDIEEDEEVEDEELESSEGEEEPEETPRPPKLKQKKETARFTAVHQPEVVGMMDKVTGKVQVDIWQVLADIRNILEELNQSM